MLQANAQHLFIMIIVLGCFPSALHELKIINWNLPKLFQYIDVKCRILCQIVVLTGFLLALMLNVFGQISHSYRIPAWACKNCEVSPFLMFWSKNTFFSRFLHNAFILLNQGTCVIAGRWDHRVVANTSLGLKTKIIIAVAGVVASGGNKDHLSLTVCKGPFLDGFLLYACSWLKILVLNVKVCMLPRPYMRP